MPLPGGPPAGAGAGPATAPGPMPGSAHQGMAALKVAMEALQKALPQIPMGSKLHQSVVKAVGDIGKHMEDEGGGAAGGDQVQQLIEMIRNAKQNPGMAGMMPPPGGGMGGAPPAPPAPPMGG